MSMGFKYIDRVLIADDHPLITERISDILNQYFTINELLTFTDSDKVIDEISQNKADLYILDLEFKGMTGFELIKAIRNNDANAKIIINTMHDQIWTIHQLQQLNVNGIIIKATPGSPALYFKEAIEAVMDGRYFYSPRIEELKSKIQSYQKGLKTKKGILSKAETSVLRCIIEGHTSKEIGKLLFVSEDTIESHRKSLFLKLKAKNVAQLVAIAFQNRLVE